MRGALLHTAIRLIRAEQLLMASETNYAPLVEDAYLIGEGGRSHAMRHEQQRLVIPARKQVMEDLGFPHTLI